MKTMLYAAAAVLALGSASAFAGDGDGPHADTFFTQLPGVIAQAPTQQQVPSAVATNRYGSQTTGTFVTNQHGAISIFPPDPNGGANS